MEASTQISYIVGENSTSGAADVKRIFCGLASRWFCGVGAEKNIWFGSQHQSNADADLLASIWTHFGPDADDIGWVVSSTLLVE